MSLANRVLRIGFVGCGRAASILHAPALARLRGVEIAAIADIDREALNRLGERIPGAIRHGSHEPLLADPSIDLVAVCVPTPLHVPIGLSVLDAGKHLFVEKPLALSLRDCDRLIEKARSVPAKVMLGFNLRFHRLVRAARGIVRDGALGRIEAIRSTWTTAIRQRQAMPEWRNRRDAGGGSLFEIAVHHLDLWCFLLDTEVREIVALDRSVDSPDETVSLSARMTDGCVASGLFSERTSDGNEIEILGRKGRLRLSLYQFDGFEFTPASRQPGITDRLRKAAERVRRLPEGISLMRQGGDYLLSYRNEWRHLIEAIHNDGTVESTLDDGRRALRAVLAAIESTSLAKTIRVDGPHARGSEPRAKAA